MTMRLHRRGAFTLLELIVVIGIIVLLLSLTAGAVFRVRESQLEKNSTETVRKIDIQFQRQWKAVFDAVNKEPIPPAVKEATRDSVSGQYDPVRARAMHTRLRMRQEFPQNFGEVLDKYTTGGYPGAMQQMTYSGKLLFLQAIKNPVLVGSDQEGAAMLYLILSQGFGGVTFEPEKAGPTKVMNFQQQNAPDIQLRVFVDEWGTPISFRRIIDDDMVGELMELNQAPFVDESRLRAGKSVDPLDPEGRLAITTWPEYQPMFKYFAQPNPAMRPYIVNPFDGKNRGPFVFSAGKDQQWLPPADQDNIFSFRIQKYGKGN